MKQTQWWATAFRIAVIDLGILPNDFWNLSLPEFNILIEQMTAHNQIDTPNRNCLDMLMKSHPDKVKSETNEEI